MDSIANVEQGSAMVQFAYLKAPLVPMLVDEKGAKGMNEEVRMRCSVSLNRTIEEFWRWNLRTG